MLEKSTKKGWNFLIGTAPLLFKGTQKVRFIRAGFLKEDASRGSREIYRRDTSSFFGLHLTFGMKMKNSETILE